MWVILIANVDYPIAYKDVIKIHGFQYKFFGEWHLWFLLRTGLCSKEKPCCKNLSLLQLSNKLCYCTNLQSITFQPLMSLQTEYQHQQIHSKYQLIATAHSIIKTIMSPVMLTHHLLRPPVHQLTCFRDRWYIHKQMKTWMSSSRQFYYVVAVPSKCKQLKFARSFSN